MFTYLLTFISTVSVAAAVPLARSVQGEAYTSLVVFGDSFSDNGNGANRISNGTWPLVPPYYQGGFSNGPVWADYLATTLSLPLQDYAVGGATTSNALIQGFTGPGSLIPVPGVAEQVATFLASPQQQNTTTNTNPLFVLWGGANDVFFNPTISATQSGAALAAAAASLRAAYPAAGLLTVAYPDLARLPYAVYVEEDAVGGKRALRAFGDLLAEVLADAARSGGVVDGNVDMRGLFEEFEYFATPISYGFGLLGKYGSCLVGVYGEGGLGGNGSFQECGDVAGWVYWDEYHPTTHTHSWIAKEILKALS